jgi:putative colanic acid biosynthesis UDP-glucose lipid carrier transferase
VLELLERLDIGVVVLALFICLTVFDEPLTWSYAALAGITAMLCAQFVASPDLRNGGRATQALQQTISRLFLEWGALVGALLFAGFAFKVSDWYSRSVLLTWFAVTPFALLVTHELQLAGARWLSRAGAVSSTFVTVGVNSVGVELERRMTGQTFLGFFDFRGPDRLRKLGLADNLLGHCSELGNFVRSNAVSSVYITLPISNGSRIRALLDDLRNSTASVYFVPDIFAFDLIQARVVDLDGIPALAVCDTPLHGKQALAKLITDYVLASVALIALSPLLLATAIAIKLDSRGPILFRQRRYGIAGEEISIFKFRSMSVLEDGTEVRQASQHDARVTRVGRVIRRSSIDELPQLLNVLQGRMSLVGPRPHAIAHNELYRRQISGYMVRHKVRPGITGWAQVHGLRGETDTVEKMALRVRYDLEYLRRWSWLLDIKILARTAIVVLRGSNAY